MAFTSTYVPDHSRFVAVRYHTTTLRCRRFRRSSRPSERCAGGRHPRGDKSAVTRPFQSRCIKVAPQRVILQSLVA